MLLKHYISSSFFMHLQMTFQNAVSANFNAAEHTPKKYVDECFITLLNAEAS